MIRDESPDQFVEFLIDSRFYFLCVLHRSEDGSHLLIRRLERLNCAENPVCMLQNAFLCTLK